MKFNKKTTEEFTVSGTEEELNLLADLFKDDIKFSELVSLKKEHVELLRVMNGLYSLVPAGNLGEYNQTKITGKIDADIKALKEINKFLRNRLITIFNFLDDKLQK